jgi:trimethylamine--corrinoid protein Co-methyltransferase
LAGANLIYGSGMTESGVTFDCAQFVIDNEYAHLIKQVVRGIRVDDETLMIDDIHAVGAFGDFLSLDSTMRFMREQSQPRLLDRRVREEWEAAGATTLYERGRAMAREILASHTPVPLDADVAAQLRRFVDAADHELVAH